MDPCLTVAVNTTHSNLIFFFFDTFHGTLILNVNQEKMVERNCQKKIKSREFPWIGLCTQPRGLPGEEKLLFAPVFRFSTWSLLSPCTEAVLRDDKGRRLGCGRP